MQPKTLHYIFDDVERLTYFLLTKKHGLDKTTECTERIKAVITILWSGHWFLKQTGRWLRLEISAFLNAHT